MNFLLIIILAVCGYFGYQHLYGEGGSKPVAVKTQQVAGYQNMINAAQKIKHKRIENGVIFVS